MKSSIIFLIELILSFLPFLVFVFLNSKANVKKEVRHQQYLVPLVAAVYCLVLMLFMDKISGWLMMMFLSIAELLMEIELFKDLSSLIDMLGSWGVYLTALLFNSLAMVGFVIIKRTMTLILGRISVQPGSWIGTLVGLIYYYDEKEECWYLKTHFGQSRKFIKAFYIASSISAGIALLVSFSLYMRQLISTPFYPVFAVIMIGEIAYFVDGLEKEEQSSDFSMQGDKSTRIAMYPLLRKPLKTLFGDKLSAEGTTVNNVGITGGGVEDILVNIEKDGTHIGKNYAMFIRKKMADGLKPNVDYVRSGYDLASGKSLLFNTPFYDKLNPYVFYAMNRVLLTGGKVMVVLGRHGTEDDLYQWCENGMQHVSNINNYWNISCLNAKKLEEDDLPDIGIVSCSSVHDLDMHKNNLPFLRMVSFVLIVEPSRLVTTAQIGLNLLIKNCDQERGITFCSVDRNCDGLVDALSHILMTNITEVSATEYPHGTSSFMYWTADSDYLQHRILPGVSRCLGMGTELSMVALKNQVKKTVWYGGDVYPVRDVRWIAKQYYYDLLDYAQMPTTQETFDSCFQTSFNMCNESVNDYSYITVEDERNNLFEIRRNFATIAEQQGFVNVISSDYMLREYMSDNTELFTADAKAIPYITADYARTKRNVILTLCLQLCVDTVQEDILRRQMIMLNLDSDDVIGQLWKEICQILSTEKELVTDDYGTPILLVKYGDDTIKRFIKANTILFKRIYSVESGKFESVYTIENEAFRRIILDDLQNASYIAEQDSKDVYIGTELKGHVYQKYMPGQFFTLNGKYYEMVSTTNDDRILVRRAADHIGGRLAYRQLRKYTLNHITDSTEMGALKSINNIDIHYQFADISVATSGYWKLHAHNDFDEGTLVTVNGVPTRRYQHKQILKFDFSKLGEAFTDSIRITLTNLMNEVFVTLFADNQPFISAVTPGEYEAPITYSLELDEESDKCIYIIEDSQLDLGLLIAVERNLNRIFQIIADYLNWNDEKIAESILKENEPKAEVKKPEPFDVFAEPEGTEKKKGFFGRIAGWFRSKFKKKSKTEDIPISETQSDLQDEKTAEETAPAEKLEDNDAKQPVNEETTAEPAEEASEEVVEASDSEETLEVIDSEQLVSDETDAEPAEETSEEVVEASDTEETQEVDDSEQSVNDEIEAESEELISQEISEASEIQSENTEDEVSEHE